MGSSPTNPSRSTSRRTITRRQLIVGSGSAMALAALGTGISAMAQNATPPPAQGGTTPAPSPVALPMVPPELDQYADDWPAAQGNIANHRAASNPKINASNVGSLEVAWSFPIKASGAYGGMTCTPIIAGKNVYVQDMLSNVFALDRDSGKVVWEKDYNASTEGPNGVTIGYGMIFGSTGDNREVFALDAATGEEKWRTILSGNTRDGIDMAPAVYNGVVYISTVPGNSKAFYDGGARGVLFGLDAASGQILWQFYTTDADLWGNPSVNSGGGSWYPPAIDEKGNLYWDIANPAPFQPTQIDGTPAPNGSTREGPNLYTDCLVALAPDGSLTWYYAANPHDIFDHDLQQSPVLVTVENDGNPYTALLSSGKLGEVIAVESTTGNMVWTTKVGEHNAWDESQWVPPGKTVTVLPGVAGGVESPIAYADGTVFVPILNLPAGFSSYGLDASSVSFNDASGELVALNVADGTVKWDVKIPAGSVSGATVSDDLVFAGALDGIVRAYTVKDGSLVWSFQTGAGLNSPFAIAGDLLIVPSAGAKLTSKDYKPEATPVTGDVSGPAVIAFKLKG